MAPAIPHDAVAVVLMDNNRAASLESPSSLLRAGSETLGTKGGKRKRCDAPAGAPGDAALQGDADEGGADGSGADGAPGCASPACDVAPTAAADEEAAHSAPHGAADGNASEHSTGVAPPPPPCEPAAPLAAAEAAADARAPASAASPHAADDMDAQGGEVDAAGAAADAAAADAAPKARLMAPAPTHSRGDTRRRRERDRDRGGARRRRPAKPTSSVARLLEAGLLSEGDAVLYRTEGVAGAGAPPLAGVLRAKGGIECTHCARTVSPIGFALCAAELAGAPPAPGRPASRTHLRHIFTADGRSLEAVALALPRGGGGAAKSGDGEEATDADAACGAGAAAAAVSSPNAAAGTAAAGVASPMASPGGAAGGEADASDDLCRGCGDGGDLLCCDACPATFHLECIGLAEVPRGEWFCAACRCAACGQSDDTREAPFGPRTMLLCDHCEREYHVGCLPQPLTQVPQGRWYCSGECERVAGALRDALAAPPTPLGGGYAVQLLRGAGAASPGAPAPSPPRALRAALSVLQECFHPILDHRTRTDLVPLIVNSARLPAAGGDFSGFFTLVLRHGETFLCAATLRLHGADAAEMPLVGTAFKFRKQGLCRRLVRLVEETLYGMNVRTLVLPAVPDIEPTWVNAFGFAPCPPEERRALAGHGILVFPGTSLLLKRLSPATFTAVPPGPAPPPHPITTRAGDAARAAPRPCAVWGVAPDVSGVGVDSPAPPAALAAAAALSPDWHVAYGGVVSDAPSRRTPGGAHALAAQLQQQPRAPRGTGAAAFDATPDDPLVAIGTTRSQRTVRAPSHVVEAVRELARRATERSGRSERDRSGERERAAERAAAARALAAQRAHQAAAAAAVAQASAMPPLPAAAAAVSPQTPDAEAEAELDLTHAAAAAAAAARPPGARAASSRAAATAKRALATAKAVAAVRALEAAQASVAVLGRLHDILVPPPAAAAAAGGAGPSAAGPSDDVEMAVPDEDADADVAEEEEEEEEAAAGSDWMADEDDEEE